MRLAIFWIATAGLIMLFCGVTDGADDKKDLYLMHLSMEVLRTRTMPHMMAFIVEMVNNDTRLLPGYTLHIINGFSQKSNAVGHIVKEFVNLISNPPTKIMLIGPMFTPEAKVIAETSALYDIIEISYYVSSSELSDTVKYPYFARTMKSTGLFIPAMVRVLKYYNWNKVAMISETLDYVMSSSDHFKELLVTNNITLLDELTFDDSPAEVVRELKESEARIIVMFSGHVKARYIMCEVYRQGLYGQGYQLLFWNDNGHFHVAEEKFEGTGCTKDEVHHACHNQIVFSASEPTANDEETIVGDSSYTTNQLVSKYSDYLAAHGHDQSTLQLTAFDAIWTAAKALTASIPLLDAGETLDKFSYGNEKMSNAFFNSITKLRYQGASGPMSFNEKGDRDSITIISQHSADGGTDEVGQYDPADASLTWSDRTAVRFLGGTPPLDTDAPVSIINTLDSALFWIATVLAIFGIAFAVACIAFNIYYRNRKVVEMSSPIINTVIAFGCGLSLLFIPFLGIDNDEEVGTSSLCAGRIFIIVFGFTFAFCGLLVKTWKAHIAYRKTTLTWPITDIHLVAFIGIIIIIDIVLLVIWQVSDALEIHIVTFDEEIQVGRIIIHQVCTCDSEDADAWMVVLCWFKSILLIIGILFAWETRNERCEELNDSQEIGTCVYVIAVASAACVPIYRLLDVQELNWSFGIISLGVLVSALVTLMLVFGPKMHQVLTNRGDDTTQMFSGNVMGASTTTVASSQNGDGGNSAEA